MYQRSFVCDCWFFCVICLEKCSFKSILRLNIMQYFHSNHGSEVSAHTIVYLSPVSGKQTVAILKLSIKLPRRKCRKCPIVPETIFLLFKKSLNITVTTHALVLGVQTNWKHKYALSIRCHPGRQESNIIENKMT